MFKLKRVRFVSKAFLLLLFLVLRDSLLSGQVEGQTNYLKRLQI